MSFVCMWKQIRLIIIQFLIFSIFGLVFTLLSSKAVFAVELFNFTHEVGDLSGYNSTSTDGGDLSVTSNAALGGSNYGMQVVVNDTTDLIAKVNLNALTTFRTRFYFDPNSLVMNNNDRFNLLTTVEQDSPWNVQFIVELNYINSQYVLAVKDRSDGTWTKQTSCNLTNDTHMIEVSWKAATGPGMNNGEFSLWVDGSLIETVTDIDN